MDHYTKTWHSWLWKKLIFDHLKRKKLEGRHIYLVNDVDDQTQN